MNLKQAKKLRKLARGIAEVKGGEVVERAVVEIEKNRKKSVVPKRDENGGLILNEFHQPTFDIIEVAAGTYIQLNDTVRGIYRRMKKVAKSKIKPVGDLQPV
jgi:hypothetical protein